MPASLALRAAPSGPLVDIIDPELVAQGRVVCVNNRTSVPEDLQTGSPGLPYSTLAAGVAALVLTGGVIVVAPGDYSNEPTLTLGSQELTITNVEPHPNYAIGALLTNLNVSLPSLSGTGPLNLIGCRLGSTKSVTTTSRMYLDSFWNEGALTLTTLDAFDCRFASTGSITMQSGCTISDSELDAQTITSSGASICRLVDCLLATSFTYNCAATGSLRMDARTASAYGSITISHPNATPIFETAATGSGQQIVATPSGALGVVDITSLGPGGSWIAQPTGNFNIDGFTAKQNGFWFDVVFDQANTTHIGTLNYDVGATLTSMRTPQTVAYHFLRNTTLRLRYQFNRWRVEVPSSSFINVAPLIIDTAINRASPFVVYRSFTAGGGGAADDVTIVHAGNITYPIRVLDAWLHTLTAVGGSSAVVRTATGGVGTAMTSALASAVTGVTRNNDATTRNAIATDGLFLRRSDSGTAGDITLLCVRTG